MIGFKSYLAKPGVFRKAFNRVGVIINIQKMKTLEVNQMECIQGAQNEDVRCTTAVVAAGASLLAGPWAALGGGVLAFLVCNEII